MANQQHTTDEIEVINLKEYACTDKPIPERVKYFAIEVDQKEILVQSPIKASEILIAANLDPEDYHLKQKFKGEKNIDLESDQLVDLREPGVECFKSIPTKEICIIINGREKIVDNKKLSFDQIVHLAFSKPPHGENTCFTVEYRKGPKQNKEGSLTDGETVKIKKGMIFNVTATDKS